MALRVAFNAARVFARWMALTATIIPLITAGVFGGTDMLGDELPPHARLRMGTTRLRHGDIVTGVGFTPDGSSLVSSSCDGTISFWDPAAGKEQARLLGHEGQVFCLDVSRDGRYIVSGGIDETVRLWSVAEKRELRTMKGHTGWVLAVCLSHDGKLIASGSNDDTIRLWSADDGRELAVLKGHEHAVLSICFSPDNSDLVSGGRDGTARVWDVAEGRQKRAFPGHGDGVSAVAISPNGHLLATAAGDPEATGPLEQTCVNIWDRMSGGLIRRIESTELGPAAIQFSADSAALLIAEHKRVRVVNMADGHDERMCEFGTWVTSIAIDRLGAVLAVGTQASTIDLLDVVAWKSIFVWSGHTDCIWGIAAAGDGRVLATSGSDELTAAWDSGTGKLIARRKWKTNFVGEIAFVCNDSLIAVSGGAFNEAFVDLWDPITDEVRDRFGSFQGLASIASDGRMVVVGSNKREVELWDTSTRQRNRLPALKSATDVSISARFEHQLVAALQEERLIVWDVLERKIVARLKINDPFTHGCLFCGADKILTYGDRDAVKLFDIKARKRITAFTDGNAIVRSAAVSPDAQLVAAGCVDGGIRMWRLSDAHLLTTLRGHRGVVACLSFIPGTRWLASGGADTSLLIWDLATVAELGDGK